MRTTTVLVAAAGISHAAAATFGGFKGFRGASPFACPTNTDNACEEKQREGFDWSDLVSGKVDFEYHGFKFAGFTCKDRDEKAGREVEGECGPDKGAGPSFEYGEGFSIDEIEISTEFDTDLEFVYSLPDGKECKQRSSCKEGGSVVKNTQCGGAKKVVLVHPPQEKKQEKCKVKVRKIQFNCESAKPPKSSIAGGTSEAPKSISGSLPGSSGTSEVPAGSTTASSSGTSEATDESGTDVSSSPPEETASEPEESTGAGVPTTTAPEEPETTPSSSSPGESTGGPDVPSYTEGEPPGRITAPEESKTTASSSSPGESTGEPVVPGYTEGETPGSTTAPEGPESTVESSSPDESTPVPSESAVETTVTSRMTTSTIFTTTTSTVTSCGPEVSGCPEGEDGTAVVTLTIPVSTTVCPVTEESSPSTTGDSSPESPTAGTPDSPETSRASSTETSGGSSAETSGASEVPGTTRASTAATTAASTSDKPTVSAPEPQETLPCPEVVPSCLNTWLFDLDCPDNTDTACFCPSAAFVENVFTCIYAHGESDAVISEALRFVQGICADHAPKNPGIVTGVNSITSVITVPEGPKPSAPAQFTTVIVSITTEVPCVTDGTTLTASLTTSVIEQTAEVPNVGFQTNSAGEVGVVPSTPAPVVVSSTVPSTLIPQPSETGDVDATAPGAGATDPPQAAASGRMASLVGVGAALFGVLVLL